MTRSRTGSSRVSAEPLVADRGRLLTGVLCAGLGALAAVAISARPEGLRAPAPIAYAACAAFVLAGAIILTIELRAQRAYRWLVVALLAAMLTPGAWIAFGPGERACAAEFAFFAGVAPALVCRTAFGFGAIILAFMLIVALRAALSSKNEA